MGTETSVPGILHALSNSSCCFGLLRLDRFSYMYKVLKRESKLDVNICKIQLQNGNKCIINGMFIYLGCSQVW